MGDSIVRKTDTRLSRGEDVVVCLPGARIEHVTERVEQIMGRGYGGSILVHIGTNNTDKEGTTAIVEKYRNLLKGNSSVTHVTFFQCFYFHWATIKHLVDQANKFKAYDDLGVQLFITT